MYRANPVSTFEDEAELITDLTPYHRQHHEDGALYGSARSDAHRFQGVLGLDLVEKSTKGSFYQGDVGGKRANQQP